MAFICTATGEIQFLSYPEIRCWLLKWKSGLNWEAIAKRKQGSKSSLRGFGIFVVRYVALLISKIVVIWVTLNNNNNTDNNNATTFRGTFGIQHEIIED